MGQVSLLLKGADLAESARLATCSSSIPEHWSGKHPSPCVWMSELDGCKQLHRSHLQGKAPHFELHVQVYGGLGKATAWLQHHLLHYCLVWDMCYTLSSYTECTCIATGNFPRLYPICTCVQAHHPCMCSPTSSGLSPPETMSWEPCHWSSGFWPLSSSSSMWPLCSMPMTMAKVRYHTAYLMLMCNACDKAVPDNSTMRLSRLCLHPETGRYWQISHLRKANTLNMQRLPCWVAAGGTFAMYSLLCRHARISAFSRAEEQETPGAAGGIGPVATRGSAPGSSSILERSRAMQKALLAVVLIGTAFMMCDGVLSPAASGMPLTVHWAESIKHALCSAGHTLWVG